MNTATNTFKIGQSPESINIRPSLEGPELILEIESTSDFKLDHFKLTTSHYDDSERYLDYSETSFDAMQPGESRREIIHLDLPKRTKHSIGDFSLVEQTWLKRHWQKITTLALVTWTLILLARRML